MQEIIPRETIEQLIFLIRGHKVMIDRDLAELHAVETKNLNRLPEHLLKYVIFHKTAYLIEKRHNDRFLKIISERFTNYQELEREMFVYWFVINRTKYLRGGNG